jgi:drug/metabolite transporter (DMT)-like permease
MYRELERTPPDAPSASGKHYSDEKITTRPRPFYAQKSIQSFIPPHILKRLDSPACWLIYYFILNLSLTVGLPFVTERRSDVVLKLHNKLVLVGFPFPWSLTACHCLLATIGSQFCKQRGMYTPANLTTRESATLVAFSLLFTINIAVCVSACRCSYLLKHSCRSNLSLNLVSVALHQVIRASTPLFAIFIAAVFLKKKHSRKTIVSLIPGESSPLCPEPG